VLERLHLFGALLALTATTLATHEHIEDVVHAATVAATSALFKAFLTVLIVDGSLLFIGQNFVGTLELLELLGVATTIWMVLKGSLSESFLNLVGGSILCYSKQFVVLVVVDFFGGATFLTTSHSAHTAEGEPSAAAAAEKHVLINLIVYRVQIEQLVFKAN